VTEPAPSASRCRIDKWLWHARFFKTRTRATRLCAAGRLRLNRVVVSKAHAALRPGDVLTFPQGAHIRVIRVVALATRRGPATEAQMLYEDLAPPESKARESTETATDTAPRERGAGRPTKADRRAIDRLVGPD